MAKRIIIMGFVCAILLSFNSCSNEKREDDMIERDDEITIEEDNSSYDMESGMEVIKEGHNYILKKKNKDYYILNLIDNAGYTINSYELYYWRHPNVSYTENGDLDFTQSLGSGLTAHQYYSFEKDVLSRLYIHVACYQGGIVCCYNADHNTVIVKNVFNAEELNQEYYIPDMIRPEFSLTAIKEAEFFESDQIILTYYSEEHGMTEKKATLNLSDCNAVHME